MGTVHLQGDAFSSLGTQPSVHQGQPLASSPMTGSLQARQKQPLACGPKVERRAARMDSQGSSGLRNLPSRPPGPLVVILVSLGTVSGLQRARDTLSTSANLGVAHPGLWVAHSPAHWPSPGLNREWISLGQRVYSQAQVLWDQQLTVAMELAAL